MTYIPNVRNKKVWHNRIRPGEPMTREYEDNPYWEGNLDNLGKFGLDIYDMCMGFVEGFFLDIGAYRDELLLAGFDPCLVDEETIKADLDLDEYPLDEFRAMSKETKIAIAMGNAILQTLEVNRNELVVGLIESTETEDEDGE